MDFKIDRIDNCAYASGIVVLTTTQDLHQNRLLGLDNCWIPFKSDIYSHIAEYGLRVFTP